MPGNINFSFIKVLDEKCPKCKAALLQIHHKKGCGKCVLDSDLLKRDEKIAKHSGVYLDAYNQEIADKKRKKTEQKDYKVAQYKD